MNSKVDVYIFYVTIFSPAIFQNGVKTCDQLLPSIDALLELNLNMELCGQNILLRVRRSVQSQIIHSSSKCF